MNEVKFSVQVTVKDMYAFLMHHSYRGGALIADAIVTFGAIGLLLAGFGKGDPVKTVALIFVAAVGLSMIEEYINKPGSSDHNLGLAVDFNNVDNNFEDLKAFKWLQKNAENYGFILRYPKDKEDITKISYESWHWRYVGEEHAKKMNELKMCLEEYIEYLQNEEF